MQEQPILRGIDNKQLKVWFQNRRCREKQKRENGDLVTENRRLAAANKLLREENDGLQKKLAQLICENEYLRNQVLSLTSTITTYDLGRQLEANNPQHPITVVDNNKGLLSLAEETKKEFLSKAIGTAINWTPVPGLKLHNPGSSGTFYVSSSCIGVAARACVTIPFDPIKIIEILKNRPSWCRRCRNMDIVAKYPGNNGGAIELIYTQYYAPTILACARDFWTLRYTCVLDDGSFLVCEKSISGSDAGPSSPAALEFVRGKMLASGYLVRPGEGGSTIHLVDHFDLEASSVPELVRPLYESSELVAKQMIVSPLHYIEHVYNEMNGKLKHRSREDPVFLRNFSQKICRVFNDAVNCFSEDGWTLVNADADASDDFIMSIKRVKHYGKNANCDSLLCVKTSLLLHNVFPASLVKLLNERRTAWMYFNFAEAFPRAACFAYPGPNSNDCTENPVVLGHTNHDDETIEVIQYESSLEQRHLSSDLYHIQVINGMDDTGFGACSELIFAPIDRAIPNEADIITSGFRIISLGSNKSDAQATENHPSSMLILAFQFPFEAHLQEDVAAMAQLYVQHVLSSVKNISLELSGISNPEMNPTETNPVIGFNITPETTYAVTLANWMCQSYRSILGVDILGFDCQTNESVLEQILHHRYAILCFSFTSLPVCLFANQAAFTMLDTTRDDLQTLPVDRILGGSNNLSLFSILPTIMQQGYVILPPGRCLSVMNRCVSYGQGVVWQVRAPDGSVHCLALAFIDWSFIEAL